MIKSRYNKIALSLIGANLLLFGFSCFSGACDWYRENVYIVISDFVTMLTDSVSVCIGEILMVFGALIAVVSIIIAIVLLFFRNRRGAKKFGVAWFKCVGMGMLILILIYMLNWVLPFRATTFSEQIEDKSFSLEEQQLLRNYMVENLNELAFVQKRDENGCLIYPDDIEAVVIQAMQKQGVQYTKVLLGRYPHIKESGFSRILDFMDIGGYTYPYSMEITLNRYVDKLYSASLMAHEHSHHQGFYQEDEANFLAYISLVNSDEVFLRYVGYWSMVNSIDREYVNHLVECVGTEAAKQIYQKLPQIVEQVYLDERNSIADKEELIQRERSELADKIAPTAKDVADVGWSVQKDLLQENYYDGVTLLVLDYYRGTLY